MNQLIFLLISVAVILFFLGCGPKTMIPPNLDLRKYPSVGFIDLACEAEGNLDDCVNERFLETVQGYQKDASIVRLGSQDEVLRSVAADHLDEKVIQAIGRKYNVSAVIAGTVQVLEVRAIVEVEHEPKTESGGIQPGDRSMEAMVNILISAGLWETEQGTTVWTASASGIEKVERVSMLTDGRVLFDAKDYRLAYRDLVKPLIKNITSDFKIRHKRI